ncbi:MAG: cupredoxin domain-containing protein [bacterium]|nr:cupredoxin domain-containing protein [bacterium]
MNEQTKVIVFTGIVIGIVATLGTIAILQKGKDAGISEEGKRAESERTVNPNALPTVEGGTREKILQGVETPESGGTSTEGVAVPRYTTAAGRKGEALFRVFNIEVVNNAFIPETIVVNDMDLIKLEIQAKDGDYDVFFPDFGVYKELPEGETVNLQFQAAPFGKYTFFCKNTCNKDVRGTLIVNKQEE